MKQIFCALLMCFFLLQSCKKEIPFLHREEKTTLPNFGNVNLKDVFHRKDNNLENKDSIVSLIEDYYKNVWENGDLSGGFLVAKGDEIIFENYRGFGREFNQMPINKETPLHIASISKTITAMAVLKLVEAGKLKLNQKLTSIFPQFPYPNVEILHLLNQRSGLPKYEYFIEKINLNPNIAFLTNKDILQLLIQHKPELSRETNTGFMYCNTNYALLALVVEKITKKPFPQAMHEMVFHPLKMKHTFVFQEKDISTASQSFYYRGNRLYPLDRLDLIYGDKNVYTTPRDLLNFSRAMYSKDFLRPSLKDSIFTPYSNEKPGINNYGLGFRMKVFDNGEKLTYHNGWWHGSNTVFAHLQKSHVTIIALGNKYSRRVYSAISLSGLFENFPFETERFKKEMNLDQDSIKKDSLNGVESSDGLGE